MNKKEYVHYDVARICISILAVIAGTWLPGVEARAQVREIAGELRLAGAHTDNIARTPTDTIDEDIIRLGFDFDYFDESSTLTTVLTSSFDYLDYRDNTFEDQLVGGLSGLLDIGLYKDRLNWIIQDNFGQEYIDPLRTPNPNNLENVNFFTTGPTLQLPVGARGLVGLDLRYSAVTYEIREFDERQQFAGIRFGREIFRDKNLTINATQRDIEYDGDASAQDYSVREGFLRLDSSTGRNVYGIDVGYSEVERPGATAQGPLFGVDWTRTVSAMSAFQLNAGSRYFDGAGQFRNVQQGEPNIGDPVDIDANGNPFRNNYIGAEFSIDSQRTQFLVQASWGQEEYEFDDGNNRELAGLTIILEREFGRNTFVEILLRHVSREFTDLGRTDTDGWYSLGFGYRINPAFSVTLGYAYFTRESDFDVNDYDENRVGLTLTYLPSWGRQ